MLCSKHDITALRAFHTGNKSAGHESAFDANGEWLVVHCAVDVSGHIQG